MPHLQPENQVPGREVLCMNPECGHQFKSFTRKPICSKCNSRHVEDLESVPRTYGGKVLSNLRKEINKLKKDSKKSEEYNVRIFGKLLDRIKALESRQE